MLPAVNARSYTLGARADLTLRDMGRHFYFKQCEGTVPQPNQSLTEVRNALPESLSSRCATGPEMDVTGGFTIPDWLYVKAALYLLEVTREIRGHRGGQIPIGVNTDFSQLLNSFQEEKPAIDSPLGFPFWVFYFGPLILNTCKWLQSIFSHFLLSISFSFHPFLPTKL